MTLRLLFLASLLAFGLIVPPDHSAAASKTFAGKRIIFEEDVLRWASKEAADEALARIRIAGFTAFSPVVWHGRGATWPSNYAEWDDWLKDHPKQSYDPLKYLIDRAHEMGIEVHPWFTLTLREEDFLPQFAPPGTPQGAWDVHMPEFRHFMANLIAEVVIRYNVDGINLDYVRAVGLCTSNFCQADYEKRYGRNLLLDTAFFKMTLGRMPTLVEYQESDVTALVQEISQRIRAIKPNIVISADVIPLIAGTEQGQNSIDWANKGLVDVLCRMAYYRDIDANLTDKIRGLLRNPDALTIVISNVSISEEMVTPTSFYSRDGKWFADTINNILQRWPQTGLGVYEYKWLSDEQITAINAGRFKPSPPMPMGLQVK
ncbi:MAG: family 10 glycosylhydrolase [Nitrospira sp.]|nr:family 10 glycosylhydrolase [Nitrospira sp.]